MLHSQDRSWIKSVEEIGSEKIDLSATVP